MESGADEGGKEKVEKWVKSVEEGHKRDREGWVKKGVKVWKIRCCRKRG